MMLKNKSQTSKIFSRELSRDAMAFPYSGLAWWGLAALAGNFSFSAEAAVTTMRIVSPAQTVGVGVCSAAVTVQAQNNRGIAGNVPSKTQIFFTGSSASLSFFSDPSCAIRVTSTYMAAATSSKSFYFKGSSVASTNVIVATFSYVDGKQAESIVAAAAPIPPVPAPVPPVPAVATVTAFSASPASLTEGQSSTLTWASSNATALRLDPGALNVTGKTSYAIAPNVSTVYTLTASNATGSATRTLSITVAAPAGIITGRAVPSPIYGITLDDVSNVSDKVSSVRQIARFPTARIVFDPGMPATYYADPILQLRNVSYIMGQLADSSAMGSYSVSSYTQKAQGFMATLGSNVDIWEIGNEVNGNWLGANVQDKIRAGYNAVAAQKGATALTFFYEGEPTGPNCIVKENGGDDMFSWINGFLQLNLPAEQRNADNEKLRLGLTYVLVSWYPDNCGSIKPDWTAIFNKLAVIFPNAKVGFGELGTTTVQNGSLYEVNLINEFYPLAAKVPLPASYIGGYFWWNYASEMIPTTKSNLFNVMNEAILAGP